MLTVYDLKNGMGCFPSPWVNQYAVDLSRVFGPELFSDLGGELFFCSTSIKRLPIRGMWPLGCYACVFIVFGNAMYLTVATTSEEAEAVQKRHTGIELNWYFVPRNVFEKPSANVCEG